MFSEDASVRPVLIGVDGNSGVGKTTTARAVAERLGYACLPELGTYFDAALGDRLPSFPGRDARTVAREAAVWPAAERRRQADRAGGYPGRVLDGTTLSVLAYELARAHFGHPDAVEPTVARYRRLYEEGQLAEPALWVFLTAPAAVVQARIRARGGSRPFLTQARTMEYLDQVRRHFCDRFVPDRSRVWVDNAARPLPAVVDRVVAAARVAPAGSAGRPVLAFLRELGDRSVVRRLVAGDPR